VLDAVEAGGRNGITLAGIKRVDLVKHLNHEQVLSSLKRLKASGKIHSTLEGPTEIATFYLGRGAEPVGTLIDEATQNGDHTTMATKKRAGKKSSAKKSASKKAGKRGRTSQNILGEGEKVKLVGKAAVDNVPKGNGDARGRAIEAARTELNFIQTWGQPSPKIAETVALLEAVTARPVAAPPGS
jgi:hypothetical protein